MKFRFASRAEILLRLHARFQPGRKIIITLDAPKSLHWVACGTRYTKKEGTELGGIELQRSS